MTLVTFHEPRARGPRGPVPSLGRRRRPYSEAEMSGRFRQQQGLLQLGELSMAFVFPVPVLETDEPEYEQEVTAT